MKKIFKYIILLICIVPFLNLKAVSSNAVDYNVKKYYVRSEIEIAGGLKVREIIEVNGTYNGYYRNILFKNNDLVTFSGKESDLEGSSIYNGTSIDSLRVGVVNIDSLTFDQFNGNLIDENVTYLEEVETASNGDNGVYIIEKNDDGVNIKMYNETINDTTYFFLEYVVTNILVEHNDCAEFYYTYISKDWNDSIEDVQILIDLPYAADEIFKVWGHGQLNATIIKDANNGGSYVSLKNYEIGSGVDVRMLFDKKIFSININESKKSNMDAISIVSNIENKRANDANTKRKINFFKTYFFVGVECIYGVLIVFFTILIYKKYDKEYKSNFKGEYYRDFINDYDVENIEYLMNKNITENAFSTSLLNLIYKKAILIEDIPSDKKSKDYKFIKAENLVVSEEENIIIDTIFNKIGDGHEVTLKQIKSFSKKTDISGNNGLCTAYNTWKNQVIEKSKTYNFYEDNMKVKAGFILFSIFGIILALIDYYYHITNYIYLILGVISVIFLCYVVIFKKRTPKGNEDYLKWKSFKKFLNDFGRFGEKELPEIKLWERYLVYASIFGIAAKVQESMKMKFSEIRPNYNMDRGDILFNYFMFNNLSHDISNNMTNYVRSSVSAVSAAKASQMSSGSGHGGGFSSGGGFGGGGNSGGGF